MRIVINHLVHPEERLITERKLEDEGNLLIGVGVPITSFDVAEVFAACRYIMFSTGLETGGIDADIRTWTQSQPLPTNATLYSPNGRFLRTIA